MKAVFELRLTHAFLLCVPVAVALLLYRRSNEDKREAGKKTGNYKYLERHSSLARSGKLILIQRHGETSKNLANPPVRKEVYAKIDNATSQRDIDAAIAQWKAHSQDNRWFDDCLNSAGTVQAALAGSEVGQLLKERDIFPAPDVTKRPVSMKDTVLTVTSPFRRAIQTQAIGWQAATSFAGFHPTTDDSSRVLGLDIKWIALDCLSETPWQQASCLRHDRKSISSWEPLLDVSEIAETTPQSWVVESIGLTEVEGKLKGISQKDAHKKNADIFAKWVRTRPEEVIWITTHQGVVQHLLDALLGEGTSLSLPSGVSKPKNAKIIAFVV